MATGLGRADGAEWPLPGLGLCLTPYSHAAFFVYAGSSLVFESLFSRDLRPALRSEISLGVAGLVPFPLWWELVRHGRMLQPARSDTR